MTFILKFLLGLGGLIGGFVVVVWALWSTLKKSDDPGGLLRKWFATALVFCILVGLGMLTQKAGAAGAFIIPIGGAIFGILLGIMWAPALGALLAKPFTGIYDGGTTANEIKPLYSMAEAMRKRGKYNEALFEVRKQLEKFPRDYQGWMLLADIYARDLNDVPGAVSCVEEVIRNPETPPRNAAFAITCCADWHLAIMQDREAARSCFERIIGMFPDTEQSQIAAQRLAHLTTDEMLADQKDRRLLTIQQYPSNIGLAAAQAPQPIDDPAQEAARLVKHLDDHPLDNEAREKLALIYADHYQRLELAIDQLEQLISAPHQQPKHVAHWLNLLADLHIRINGDIEKARLNLDRITELFPNSSMAATAQKRIAYLAMEMNKVTAGKTVHLGSYAQNIGLQGQAPKRP